MALSLQSLAAVGRRPARATHANAARETDRKSRRMIVNHPWYLTIESA
jgi:hypothetical protein